MGDRARLTVTTGPDRGRVFELAEEMVNIGRGTDNEITLTDLQVAEHQATVMSRNGRYAIYVLPEGSVEVDGKAVAAEQWVWLPDTARIKISSYTGMRFQYEGTRSGNGAGSNSGPATADVPISNQDKSTPDKRKKNDQPKTRRGKPGKSKQTERKLAKFITDQGGDALVRLGEDGHLPELSLADSPTKKVVREKSQGGNSFPVMYLALGASMLMSVVLLLVPAETGVSSAGQVADAREEITKFYGNPDEEPTDWQRKLREARLAYSSGDRNAERRAYQYVLDRLNAEEFNQPDAPSHIALTLDRGRDQHLRELIAILLSR